MEGKGYYAELFYGCQTSHDDCCTYHSFELHDPEEVADVVEIGNRLAADLDTERTSDDFNWNFMKVRIPDLTVERIRNEEVIYLMSRYADDKWKAHEMFKLLWMIEHGKTIGDLLTALQEMQFEDPDDPLRAATPITELYEEWEKDVGFGGSIWPCPAEFEEAEYRELYGEEDNEDEDTV